MKYVMFTHAKTGLKLPVMFADLLTHSDICAGPGWVATSAGFCVPEKGQTSGASESLSLEPCKDDGKILALVLLHMDALLYSSQDIEANLEALKERMEWLQTKAKEEPKNNPK